MVNLHLKRKISHICDREAKRSNHKGEMNQVQCIKPIIKTVQQNQWQ